MPPIWTRWQISKLFTALQFRAYLVLYFAYAAVLTVSWMRSLASRRPFPHAFLFAFVIFGGVFYMRSLGRSDEPHLESAIPPVCLMLAHLTSLAVGTLRSHRPGLSQLRRRGGAGVCLAVLGAWIFLVGTDECLTKSRGTFLIPGIGDEIYLYSEKRAVMLGRTVQTIREWTDPDEAFLDLSYSPLLHVLADRPGPGYSDVIMPGTFLDVQDEIEFVRRLRASPPPVAIWSRKVFDEMLSRRVRASAPRLAEWVKAHYEGAQTNYRYILLRHRDTLPPAD